MLVWVVLFSLPYLLSASGQSQVITGVIAHSWIPLLFYALLFYFNYFILIDGFFFKKKVVRYVVINFVIIGICIWFREFINTTFFQEIFPKMSNENAPPKTLFIYVQILSFVIPVIFALGLKITERYLKTESERKEAENKKLKSELQHLKYQLQPHFFFNSLNNIYSLVDISPEQAKTTIHSLSKLMRYLLYETNTEEVNLGDEIQFMEKYIELMKLRLTDKTTVEYQFPKVSNTIKVAPLLFISQVENAFKHGVSASAPSHITFNMEVSEKAVIFETLNPDFSKSDADKSGSGIGLQNIEKRLQLLYPAQHEFEYRLTDAGFKTRLKIITNG